MFERHMSRDGADGIADPKRGEVRPSADIADPIRRELLSYAFSIASLGAVGTLWPHDSREAIPSPPNRDVYLLTVAGMGAPVDALLDMQQLAPAPSKTPLRPMARIAGTVTPTAQFRIALGWNPVSSLAQWLDAAVAHKPILQDGSIVIADTYLNVRAAYNWSGGSITDIELPACDAASITPASPLLTIQAAAMTQTPASGPLTGNWHLGARRSWRQQDFRIGSTAPISAPLTHIRSVSAISLASNIRGGTFDIAMGFGPDRPDLMGPFTRALQSGGPLVPDTATDITVYLLAPDLRTEIAAVVLHDCRVLSVNTPTAAATVVKMSFADASLSITPG